jgi:transposase
MYFFLFLVDDRLSFFVMVQCYSRQMYVEFIVSQTMEHFLGCHERAFAVLGVPTTILVDNLKSAVLRRLTGMAPGVQSALRRLRAPSLLRNRAVQRGRRQREGPR